MTHHSIEQSEDGGFWVPSWRHVDREGERPFPVMPPYYEDTILKISPKGEVLTEISFLGLFFRNNLQAAILYANGMTGIELAQSEDKVLGEFTHLNDVEELSSQMAAHFPQFAPGDLLLSERDYNLIMVIDPKTQKVKWHQRGPWIGQHDPDFQPNGRISVFNNNADKTQTGSSILEVDPIDGRIVPKYGGIPEQRWFSGSRGKHQYLENGNMLITETDAGRIFEVNSQGKIVWEFIARYDEDELNPISQAIRYPPDYFQVGDWSCPGSSGAGG